MPIEPVDPSKKTGGDGQEKYPAKPKHGPGEFDKTLEDAKKRFKEIADEGRKQGDIRKQYSDTGPRTGPTISGTFGPITDLMERKAKPYNKAKGGIIKSASNRADGIAQRGKTKGRIV
jgi:hypothetical protein